MKTFTSPYVAATWVKNNFSDPFEQEQVFLAIVRSKDSSGTYYYYP